MALEGTKYKKLEDLFSGPTAVALSDDAISSAKILTRFAKKNTNLKIIGGIMEEESLSIEDVAKIATLPTMNEARAKITSILQAPAQKIMSILLAPGSKIAILAHAKSKKA
jgi:large subunit ribosomal protein L10